MREDFVDLISSHWYTETSEVALYWLSYCEFLPLTTPIRAGGRHLQNIASTNFRFAKPSLRKNQCIFGACCEVLDQIFSAFGHSFKNSLTASAPTFFPKQILCHSSIYQFITRKVCILVNKGPSESFYDKFKYTSKYGRLSKVSES